VNRSRLLLLVICVAFGLAVHLPTSRAAVTKIGNVESSVIVQGDLVIGHSSDGTLTIDQGSTYDVPDNGYLGYDSGVTGEATVTGSGSLWTVKGEMDIGYSGTGSLSILDGGVVQNRYGPSHIGLNRGSSGTVTVDGDGSKWAGTTLYGGADLYIGLSGNTAILNITNHGVVAFTRITMVGIGSKVNAMVNFGANGGTLTTGGLGASPYQLTGTGTVVTSGLVSDVDLVFKSVNDLKRTITLNALQDQNVTINLDLSTNPSANGIMGAGWRGNGSLTIQNGVTVQSLESYIGYAYGSKGVANVSGNGSTWNASNDYTLYVGSSGQGVLNITNGGCVSSKYGSLGEDVGSAGTVTVDGVGSKWNCTSGFRAGNYGSGTLIISNGGVVNDIGSSLGYYSGATGVAIVDGIGSKWINSGSLAVGDYNGAGTLTISNGATVTNTSALISKYSSTMSLVTVVGSGSKWTNSDILRVGGYSGNGTLRIANAGAVTAKSVQITNRSLLAIDVGGNSKFTIGNGTGLLYNYGAIRVDAGPATGSGTYIPILAGTWSGSGIFQALGGVWNSSSHEFTVSDPVTGTAGTSVAIANLVGTQRVLISDNGENGTGWNVGAAFAATTAPTSLTLTATVMTNDALTALQTLLNPNQSVLSAWDFALGTGYTEGDPVYLSFGIGTSQAADNLRVWHYDANGWTTYAANDLTYDGVYASFTAFGFSGYAVTVPEPSILALLAAALLGLVAFVWQKPK
jgi:T5SS/PEP-CTERM-associated repeat protein